MSLRPHLMISLLVHVLILSLVWVGFAVPLPRAEVQFFYGGPFQLAEAVVSSGLGQGASRPVTVKSPEAGFFPPWMKMRDLNKPRI